MSRRHTREDSGLRLDGQQRWWHDGEPVLHPKIIEAFNCGLKVADGGRYRLEFGPDWCFVEVEAAAYTALVLDVSEGDQLSVRLSDRTAELLDVPSLATDDGGVLTCAVKAGRARARFSRDAQFALGELFERAGDGYRLRVGRRVEGLPRAAWPTGV